MTGTTSQPRSQGVCLVKEVIPLTIAGGGGTSLEITCDEGQASGCLWRIRNGEVEVIGDHEAKRIDPVVPQVSNAENDNWLSSKNIVGGVDIDGGVEISLETTAGAAVDLTVATEETINGNRIILDHDRGDVDGGDQDFLVWGAWQEPAPPGSGTSGKPTHKQVWGGSRPRTAAPPTAGSATYLSGDNNVHGFYKDGSGSWTTWSGDARLVANFTQGTISGAIAGGFNAEGSDPTSGAINAGAVANVFHSISLKPTAIGATMSGSVTIQGSETEGNIANPTSRNAPSSGSWEAGFFGPASESPTGIAGAFNAKRPAAIASSGSSQVPGKFHSAVGNLEVNGAFGAARQ